MTHRQYFYLKYWAHIQHIQIFVFFKSVVCLFGLIMLELKRQFKFKFKSELCDTKLSVSLSLPFSTSLNTLARGSLVVDDRH